MQQKKLTLKNLSRFTRGKVMIAFLAAGIAIASSWIITRIVFSDMADSVIELSEPNEKLLIVDRLLEQVSMLDQLQRVQALQEPHHTKSFLSETQEIRLTLDTLAEMYSDNAVIYRQIDSMKLILTNRDQVYIDYATLRAGQLDNTSLSGTLKNITGLVRANSRLRDSSVRTTETKITTTAAPKAKTQESLWKRLFGKRKKEEGKQFVSEEKNIRVDTLSVVRKDSILSAIERAMSRLEHEEITRTSTMLLKELNLINNGNTLVNELWRLLHGIQEDEINNIRTNKDTVIGHLNTSINRAGTIMLVLFLVIGIVIFMVLNDITRNNTYREQLRIAKENAEQLSIMKQRFLSNMSHEIRTPLQSIVGFTEQVKNQAKPQPKMIDAIHASAGHLLQIVNEVLDYSRIISGKFTLEKRPFNLNRLAEEVSANMRLQAESKKLQFIYQNTIATDTNYLGDDFRLKQILYNLLGNATKFTTSGSVTLAIEQTGKRELQIKVADTGTGISEKDLTRIFNEFEQTDTSIARKFGGTGLGLSISKTLIENMGGTIRIASKEGTGTTFTLVIPLEQTTKKPEYATLAVSPAAYADIHTVVIEDDPFILQLCDAILTNNQITHTCYSSAEELLAAEWDHSTRLVFSDMRLPGITGTELVQQLRKKVKNVKFVALTAQVLPEEKENMLKHGFDAILSKPFREQELLSFYATGTAPVNESPSTFDISLLKRMTMNDEELLNSHLSKFAEATEEDLQLLKTYVEQKNQEEVYEMIHKLAGRIGQMGASDLMSKLRELEQELKQPKRLTAQKNKLAQAIAQTEKMVEEIKRMLAQVVR